MTTPAVRLVETAELTAEELRFIRALVDSAFAARFDDHDWEHALGGVHALIESDGVALAHASVVPRTLRVAERPYDVGYVEAVATQAVCRGQGYGSAVMHAVNEVIRNRHDLGALSTGLGDFYARLGWEKWRGPSFVHHPDGPRRTAEEDDGIFVLRTARAPDLDLTAPISCDYRLGDAW